MKIIIILSSLFAPILTNNFYSQGGGVLDNTFGNNGIVYNQNVTNANFPFGMAIQTDGKIVVVGECNSGFCVRRYEINGSLDSSFGINGEVVTNTGTTYSGAKSVVIQPDGKIVVGGRNFTLVRYNPNGTLDTGFGTNGIVTTSIPNQYGNGDILVKVILLPNGKIAAIGGSRDIYDYSMMYPAMVQYNYDGSLDTTFTPNGILYWSSAIKSVCSASLHPNGKIIVLGFIGAVDAWNNPISGYYNFYLFEFETGTDGAITTNTNAFVDYLNADLVIQEDGKIVAMGHVRANDKAQVALVRFNPNTNLSGNGNGSIDISFGNDGMINSVFTNTNIYPRGVALQPDGRIVTGGYIGNSNQGLDFAVLRFTTNGLPDLSFNAEGYVITDINQDQDQLHAIAIQSDSKIVVAGFSKNGNYYDFSLARYLANSVVNLSDLIEESLFSIYPNPSFDFITIENKTTPINSNFTILNSLGQEVLTGDLNSESTTVDISKLPSGIYVIEVGEMEIRSFKIVKN